MAMQPKTLIVSTPTALTRALACLLVGAAWLALAGSVAAAPGQIAYDGCLANTAAQGCVDLPLAPLTEPDGMAVSPDGKSVYVASSFSDSIAHFFRGPDGQLAWDGCLNNDGSQNCGDVPGAPLDGAGAVAVSPDGNSVYVASRAGHSMARFSRSGPEGQIAYNGCFNNDGSQGCIDLPFAPLNVPSAVAVSPDGESVYVSSFVGDSIAHFFRGPDGQIAWDGCLSNDGSQACGDLPFAPIDGANGVAVSPDGESIYIASFNGPSIAHLFATGPQGQISWDGCLNNDGSQNCGDLPGRPLGGTSGVAVSPDGRSVYVASRGIDSIAHLFATGPQGQISWDGCLNNDGSENCRDLPGTPLDGASAVAVSPDGKSVYVASSFSDSIAHLFRSGPEGQIGWDGCLADGTAGGCGDLPFGPLDGARGVAVSPDGKSVYVASQGSNSIARFSRELVPASPGPGGNPGPAPDPRAGAGGGGEGQGGALPAFGAKTLVTLELAAKRISAKGPLTVRVTNNNDFPVSGRLSGKATKRVAVSHERRGNLKGKLFRFAAHASRTVKLKLPKPLRRLLKRERRLSLRLTARVEDPAGRTRSVTKTVTPSLKLKRGLSR